ncbi:MAG: GNAT family N-acetyltransferase [Pyrinomonadaceae bacterium]
MMKIEHEEKGRKGIFFINEEGERLAEIAYFTSAPGIITVYHTEVSPDLRGEGIGEDLVAAVVDYARKNDLKIIATCEDAKKVIVETPEFQDVLA